MVVHPASGRVIVGGSFNTLNGSQQWGMGSLDGTTGAVQPWAANTVIQNHGDGAAITSLTTDGDKIFGVGWTFVGGGADANFEGVFSADPMTGVLDWIDGGRGDNYEHRGRRRRALHGRPPPRLGHARLEPAVPDPWQFQRADGDQQAPLADADERVRDAPTSGSRSRACRRRSRCTGCRR